MQAIELADMLTSQFPCSLAALRAVFLACELAC